MTLAEFTRHALEILAPVVLLALGTFASVATAWLNARRRREGQDPRADIETAAQLADAATGAVEQTFAGDLKDPSKPGAFTPARAAQAHAKALAKMREAAPELALRLARKGVATSALYGQLVEASVHARKQTVPKVVVVADAAPRPDVVRDLPHAAVRPEDATPAETPGARARRDAVTLRPGPAAIRPLAKGPDDPKEDT